MALWAKMELVIPLPSQIEYAQNNNCKCCLGHHFEDSHTLSHTIITFETPNIYSPYFGLGAMRLAHEYTCKPSMLMLALHWPDHMECTENCGHSNEVDQECRFSSPENRGSRIKEKGGLDKTFLAFLDLPREIRNDIYVRVLGSSKDHWAIMTASIPLPKTSVSNSNISRTRFKYSFGSKQLQLLCHQIRNEVLEVCQSHAQDIWLRELGVSDFDAALSTFKHKDVLRHSARSITLVYSSPILSRDEEDGGRHFDRCSFLTQIIEPFQSLIKLCPNVESVFISLVAQNSSGRQIHLGLYIPCHDRNETTNVQVDYRWYKVANWECVIRKYFSTLRKVIGPEEKDNFAVWQYSCGCIAHADVEITVSDEEKRRARLGSRRINVTVKEIV
ncbi:hypothetical protein VE01_03631 [Pseudogymnoascus verrucosus]|uniref:F-box domain-containing protein n=1 Tax=Pseudogymnoascus verrucosus TaxID=342668 RepID=A0A1B8GRT6_9PEZI|nr:uncharacterized protein VE01_03631 [Pseudogymnoascus verrucosus]OBT98554.1 hypothetical protein VE01_03631 [Pseudogymnoascus verrucosus]